MRKPLIVLVLTVAAALMAAESARACGRRRARCRPVPVCPPSPCGTVGINKVIGGTFPVANSPWGPGPHIARGQTDEGRPVTGTVYHPLNPGYGMFMATSGPPDHLGRWFINFGVLPPGQGLTLSLTNGNPLSAQDIPGLRIP
jgi:hypothetical protein